MTITITEEEYQELMRVKREHEALKLLIDKLMYVTARWVNDAKIPVMQVKGTLKPLFDILYDK